MKRFLKWFGVVIILLVIAVVASRSWIVTKLGGDFDGQPSALADQLSKDARALLDRAFAGIDTARLADYHVHIVATGSDTPHAFVHPAMRSWRHPLRRARFLVYLSAAGVEDVAQADKAYRDRFLDLVRHVPGSGRYLLLPFDRHVAADGSFVDEKTEFYMPNDAVAALADKHGARLVAAASVHPYRKDAIARLEAARARGARIVKWLPNAMGMDPASPQCDAFYAALRRLDMAILTHGGEEKAVEADADQVLGDPRRLRRALDAGVKVIVAHAASLGQNGGRTNFDHFMELMEEPRYRGLVFGEISATVQFNRLPRPLLTLLDRRDLHDRLVNGSDYPLPAVNFLIRTGKLRDLGLITDSERDALNEIYRYHPLLFDFVLKRTLRSPDTGRGFAPRVFYEHAKVPLR